MICSCHHYNRIFYHRAAPQTACNLYDFFLKKNHNSFPKSHIMIKIRNDFVLITCTLDVLDPHLQKSHSQNWAAANIITTMTAPTPPPKYIYKILPSNPAPPSPLPEALPISSLDARDGFLHMSTSTQILGTLRNFFANADAVYILRILYEDVILVLTHSLELRVGVKWKADVRLFPGREVH